MQNKVISNTDGEDTQKVSLGELLLNAGTRIVDLEKQSNDQVEIITHLEEELASLREQHLFERASREGFIKRLEQQLQQKEDENQELWNKAVTECIVIIRNAVKTGFPHYHIASVLQTLKRKENEPEFTHPDETED